MHEIVVIGAGISGTLTALELAANHRILLIESGKEILPDSCTSRNQCFKLHTGLHYFGNIETAKLCLKKAIAFAKEFPDCILGRQNLNASYRRGRHFVMSNSLVKPEEAIKVAIELKELYIQLIASDPKNKVFGDPDRFFKVLSSEEYSYLSKDIPCYDESGSCHKTSVVLGIETAESLVDFNALRMNLRQKVSQCPNITVLPNTKVLDLIPRNETQKYKLSVVDENGFNFLIETSFVVNCAWQNIELIGKKIHSNYLRKEAGVNRIKITTLVQLPEQLHSMHTCLFSTGPYCSITVLANGEAILASERLTNVGYYPIGEEMPKALEEKVQQITSQKIEGNQFARQILEDCSAYFCPSIQSLMMASKIKEVRVGIVKQVDSIKKYDNTSIYRHDSIVHSRLDTGVCSVIPGYIANASMKMVYALDNAKYIKEIVEHQLQLDNNPLIQSSQKFFQTQKLVQESDKQAITMQTSKNV